MKKYFISFLLGFSLFMLTGFNSNAQTDEMSAAWISTVYNLDWPSSTSKNNPQMQKQELINMLDELKETGINTVILQVRPKADALYKSSINPWSDVLTGTAGKDPGYDPLKFAIEEAHKRNMDIHAWFNPYRVTTSGTDFNKLADNSPARLHPNWVVSYNNKLYYDPGLPEVREHIVDTITEVVRNYNIDGIHFDDYFYPDSNFTDSQTYNKYGNGMEIGDWRRSNVNNLLKDVKTYIKSIKTNVKFGVSPSGIWRNKSSDPTGSDTRGSESYSTQYADTRYWIKNNLIDYVTPQVYWPIGYSVADYSKLVSWWSNEVSGSSVNLYIGQGIYKQGTGDWVGQDIAGQITQQINLNRQYPNIKGSMYFSSKDIICNEKLQQDLKSIYNKVNIKNIKGIDRYETAVEISKTGWQNGSNTVIIANGTAMFDGISATPLATCYDSPILLSKSNDLTNYTKQEIKRLNPQNIIIIGGENVIKKDVINQLNNLNYNFKISRIGGSDRYETNLMIAKEISKYSNVNKAYIASGIGEADSLSIASFAGKEKQPIILCKKDIISKDTLEWLKSKYLNTAYFLGGELVLEDSVIKKINEITNEDVSKNRLYGLDRHETNSRVIEQFYPEDKYKSIFVVKSDPLADALTSGPLAAKLGIPIIMVKDHLIDMQRNILLNKSCDLIYEIGGLVPQSSIDEIIDLLN
ncbi:cell surface protein [Paraclostridium benzoelyticum]|uniref:Cell surface protein n=1 Tax=Paraclostridium benzoelyticum TaxID=1629550 RepID=A0A0M3DJ49_9FIRM|nr:family 10 glycosylhydrolase [Paraclostridium benzoelyticum]KKY02176.1 cell surface protein [Paraclostridium benzoelyticum]OXX84632.1 cell surface protein [Paraclostridium benzoelyticum]